MKRFLSFFLVAILVILQIPGIGLAVGEGEGENPRIIITSSNSYTAEGGESLNITVKIKNNSRDDWADAYDITGTLGNDPTGMVYIDGSSYDSVKELRSGNTSSLSFRVKVDEMAEDRNYTLPLNISYYNFDGVQQPTITETINIRVKNTKTSPQIVVSRVDIMPSNTVSAGDVIAVGFALENIGTGPAKDLKISLEGLSNDEFSLAKGVNSKIVQLVEIGGKSYVYFELKASQKIKAGNYELKMNMSYKDIKNETIKEESNFFITVASGKDKSSNIIIENLSYPTSSIGQNKEANISFDIRNQGQMDAKNIIITANSADQTGLVPKTVSTIKINSLAKGATEKIDFKFLSTSSATTKNYPIEITVSYTDDFGEKSEINQFVGLFVNAPEEGDPAKGKPKLIIDKYSFEPQLVKAGENFNMTLSFYNTSSKKAVKNIKIFLTAEAGSNSDGSGGGSSAFTPVDSSNTFYIDSIPPKGRVEKTITMFTIPDAIAKTHTITANFEYEDSEGTELKDIELIGVPVVQNARLETGELSYFPEAMVGEPVPVSLEFYNTGKVTLYNMMVKLEGNFQMENGSYYVGNFASGGSEFFEGMVIPNEPGELTGEVVFTYEDSTGQEQELRKDFTLNVMEMPPMEEFPGDMPPMEDQKPGGIKGILKSKWLWISLVAILAIVGGVIIYKKKKKKKEMSFDE